MKLRDITRARWFALSVTIIGFALAFVLAVALHGLTHVPWGNWHAVLDLGLFFAVLGVFYGTIVALDPASGASQDDRPRLRSLLCGALGATAVLLTQAWPPHTFNVWGPLTGFLVGGTLGWLGWSWAKYVDF